MSENFWWKKATVYQIYPRSFKDSNGTGIGDINGIIEKVDYLSELGIDVVWLTPIYVSPQKDNGYDIADYYNIDPLFGTIQDFEKLLKKLHEKKIKLIMDMVINHTSTENFWFKEALKGEKNPCHDFYIWKKGIGNNPPNNWTSKFGGSAWEYVPSLNKFYLHLFDVSQADLNWENQKLREEIYKMMRFWMEKSVDGFRLDVINLISKNQNFPDDTFETPTHDGRKFYTDGSKIHEYLHEINKNVFSRYEGSLTVGEMSSTNLKECIKYTDPQSKEISMTFNFHHLKVDYPNGEKWTKSKFDFQLLKNILFEWQTEMQKGNGWNATFWCNHDQPRVISRFGNDKEFDKESGKMLAIALHLLRGTPYIFQGEEIGMTNPYFDSIKKYRDVESLNAYKKLTEEELLESEILEILSQKSRDNSRTPVQWNSKNNAGFTAGIPWIEVCKNYEKINVEKSLQNKNSIFYCYKKLIELRKNYEIISDGQIIPYEKNHDKVFSYYRIFQNQKLLVVCNFFPDEVVFNIPDEFLVSKNEIIIKNYDNIQIEKTIKLRAYEAFALLI